MRHRSASRWRTTDPPSATATRGRPQHPGRRLFSGEHTGGEGALKAIDRSNELGEVGVLDDDGDGTEALLEQPAAVLQSIDRRLEDRSRRAPALNGRLDELNDASTGEPQLLESLELSIVRLPAVSMTGSGEACLSALPMASAAAAPAGANTRPGLVQN